jgi:hypothetical protein
MFDRLFAYGAEQEVISIEFACVPELFTIHYSLTEVLTEWQLNEILIANTFLNVIYCSEPTKKKIKCSRNRKGLQQKRKRGENQLEKIPELKK